MEKASPRLVHGFHQAPQVGRNYACQPDILAHRMLLSQIAQHRATQHLTTQHNTAQGWWGILAAALSLCGPTFPQNPADVKHPTYLPVQHLLWWCQQIQPPVHWPFEEHRQQHSTLNYASALWGRRSAYSPVFRCWVAHALASTPPLPPQKQLHPIAKRSWYQQGSAAHMLTRWCCSSPVGGMWRASQQWHPSSRRSSSTCMQHNRQKTPDTNM